ncbi:hypothetical protein R1sor_004124 [Riccia sorocarpa]|uniref:Serine/threonine protein phosphatase 2A regulatory subunit n=1 Tax=Riccia sorocarpa TaxID=122646 RepID=A0ABD3H3L5_9MARC
MKAASVRNSIGSILCVKLPCVRDGPRRAAKSVSIPTEASREFSCVVVTGGKVGGGKGRDTERKLDSGSEQGRECWPRIEGERRQQAREGRAGKGKVADTGSTALKRRWKKKWGGSASVLWSFADWRRTRLRNSLGEVVLAGSTKARGSGSVKRFGDSVHLRQTDLLRILANLQSVNNLGECMCVSGFTVGRGGGAGAPDGKGSISCSYSAGFYVAGAKGEEGPRENESAGRSPGTGVCLAHTRETEEIEAAAKPDTHEPGSSGAPTSGGGGASAATPAPAAAATSAAAAGPNPRGVNNTPAPGARAPATANSRSSTVATSAPPGRANQGKEKMSPTALTVNNGPNPFLEPLPAFRDLPSADRQNLFIKKLNLCCYTFDFTDASKNTKEKETKRQTLLELVEYVTSGSGKFTEAVFEDITKMLVTNLFRTLPPSSHENTGADSFDPEEEEPTMEPAWPHLQIVYEFLLRYIVSSETDAKLAKRYIDHSFVLRLLDLFDSEDPREREYLKTILHRIYGKFMVHRPFIRKAINNIFYRFIFETEKHNGIAELLEILGSIINGFALPLKEEHKLFLVRALIPLHKPKCVSMYHQQLSYCITQFVEKDFKLADTVIRGLLKYWPVTNSQKEVLFLGELEEVLEATQAAEFQRCMVPLFRQIGRCLNSSHFQVAERALFLWNNDHIVSLVAQNRQVVLPLIFSALERNTRSHWNQAVHGLTLNVRKMFLEMDQELFQECQRKFQEDEAKAKELEEKREITWHRLEAAANGRPLNSEAMLGSQGLNNSLAYGNRAMVGS